MREAYKVFSLPDYDVFTDNLRAQQLFEILYKCRPTTLARDEETRQFIRNLSKRFQASLMVFTDARILELQKEDLQRQEVQKRKDEQARLDAEEGERKRKKESEQRAAAAIQGPRTEVWFVKGWTSERSWLRCQFTFFCPE